MLTSVAEKRPRLLATGGSSRQQPILANQRPATLITGASLQQVPRQPRNERPPAESADQASQILGKFLRLASFNQLALILAAILCLFMLILATTIVHICYSTRPRERGSARPASSFSSGQSIGLGDASKVKRESGSICSLAGRPLCCGQPSLKLNKRTKPIAHPARRRRLERPQQQQQWAQVDRQVDAPHKLGCIAPLRPRAPFQVHQKASMRASRASEHLERQHRQPNTFGCESLGAPRGCALDSAVSIWRKCSLNSINDRASMQARTPLESWGGARGSTRSLSPSQWLGRGGEHSHWQVGSGREAQFVQLRQELLAGSEQRQLLQHEQREQSLPGRQRQRPDPGERDRRKGRQVRPPEDHQEGRADVG